MKPNTQAKVRTRYGNPKNMVSLKSAHQDLNPEILLSHVSSPIEELWPTLFLTLTLGNPTTIIKTRTQTKTLKSEPGTVIRKTWYRRKDLNEL